MAFAGHLLLVVLLGTSTVALTAVPPLHLWYSNVSDPSTRLHAINAMVNWYNIHAWEHRIYQFHPHLISSVTVAVTLTSSHNLDIYWYHIIVHGALGPTRVAFDAFFAIRSDSDLTFWGIIAWSVFYQFRYY
ncbi:hypothetical protein AXF42_Ash010807 [Apostasia shenzhenica]|uniref:Uncharacterized protein n=1 Tax=Apostasia shenzhenica TaxID=1088818 RepID=A0A2I0A0Q9_9ASPA|nr:hypothetical protein AXF42_Ash010807 [Apostasia shenzhenica]